MSEINIEQLPRGWAKVPLQEILLSTSTFNPRTVEAGEFHYIDIEAIDNKNQRLVAPKRVANLAAPSRARNAVQMGDIVFSLVRPYLKNIAIIPANLESAVASTAFFVCRPAPGMDSRFILNFLRQESFITSIITYGSSPPAARDEEFAKLSVIVAPGPEQERIADVLDELFSDLDAAGTALERARNKLRLYRASVLKAAVEGTLTAEWRKQHPHTEPVSELLKRILIERRRRWEEEQLVKFKDKEPPKNWRSKYKEPTVTVTSNLPALPEGWCWAAIEHLIPAGRGSVKTGPFGSLLKKHEHKTNGVPVYGIENIDRMRFVAGSKIHISPEKADQLSDYDAKPYDILISRSGTVGEICVVPNGAGVARISTNLMRLRLNPEIMLPQFFCLLFNGSPAVLEQISTLCSGSTRDFLNNDILGSLRFPLPPISEQEVILETVEDQISVIEHLEADLDTKLKSTQSLRQSILRHAFTGQLVSQDPNDEPASELLKRIAAERQARTIEARTSQMTKKNPKRARVPRPGRLKQRRKS